MTSTNPHIQTIDVQAKEWFDRTYGNSYFAGQVTINFGLEDEKTFLMPFQYGYGDQYLHQAWKVIQNNGYIPDPKPFQLITVYAREHNIPLRYSIQDKCKKRDVQAFGEV